MSAANTSRWLRPVWEWLFGPISSHRWSIVHECIRKTGHFTGYGLVSVCFFHGFRNTLRAVDGLRALWVRSSVFAIGCTILIASADELHQAFLPGRGRLALGRGAGHLRSHHRAAYRSLSHAAPLAKARGLILRLFREVAAPARAGLLWSLESKRMKLIRRALLLSTAALIALGAVAQQSTPATSASQSLPDSPDTPGARKSAAHRPHRGF